MDIKAANEYANKYVRGTRGTARLTLWTADLRELQVPDWPGLAQRPDEWWGLLSEVKTHFYALGAIALMQQYSSNILTKQFHTTRNVLYNQLSYGVNALAARVVHTLRGHSNFT